MKTYKIIDIAAVLMVAAFLGYAGVLYLNPEAVVGKPAATADVSGDKESIYLPAWQNSQDLGKLDAEPEVLAANAWEVSETILSEPETIYISSPELTRVSESSPSSSAASEPSGSVLSNPSAGGSSSAASSSISSPTSSSSSGSSSAASSASGSSSAKTDSSSASPKTSEASPQPSTAGNGAGTFNDTQKNKKLFMFAALRSRVHFRMLNNVKLRALFAPDFVWTMEGFLNEQEWSQMMQYLREFNSNIIIGYYLSACTTYSLYKNQNKSQPRTVPIEQVRDDWMLKFRGRPVAWADTNDRYVLDIRKPEVRHAVISFAVTLAKYYDYNALSFDNCYWGYGVPASSATVVSKKEWTDAFMKFYEEAGKEAHKNGLKCFVNVAMRAEDIPQGFVEIAPYVDGIMTEMPFHESIVKAGLVQRELDAYEKVLKMGTIVLLLQTYEGRGTETLELARPLLDKYDNLYVQVVEYQRHYVYHGRMNYDMRKAPPISVWYRRQ